MIISDARHGRSAAVDNNHNLKVFCTNINDNAQANLFGQAWAINFDVTVAGANQVIFFYENTDTNPIWISDMRLVTSVAGRLEIFRATGIPAGGTVPKFVNKNFGLTNKPNATVQRGAITGITAPTETEIVYPMETFTGINNHYEPQSHIILPQGSAIGLRWVPSTGTLNVNLALHFGQLDSESV